MNEGYNIKQIVLPIILSENDIEEYCRGYPGDRIKCLKSLAISLSERSKAVEKELKIYKVNFYKVCSLMTRGHCEIESPKFQINGEDAE